MPGVGLSPLAWRVAFVGTPHRCPCNALTVVNQHQPWANFFRRRPRKVSRPQRPLEKPPARGEAPHSLHMWNISGLSAWEQKKRGAANRTPKMAFFLRRLRFILPRLAERRTRLCVLPPASPLPAHRPLRLARGNCHAQAEQPRRALTSGSSRSPPVSRRSP